MAFQEKMAWAMVGILTVTGALYYAWVFWATTQLGHLPPPILPFLVVYVVLIIVAAALMAAGFAITNPSEANAPLDERERLIQFKSAAQSGRVFGFLIVVGLIDFAVFQNGNRFFHIAFAALIISQILEYGLTVLFYRRGT